MLLCFIFTIGQTEGYLMAGFLLFPEKEAKSVVPLRGRLIHIDDSKSSCRLQSSFQVFSQIPLDTGRCLTGGLGMRNFQNYVS
jgi:hypothetical protein